jgi:hypothetical protein
MVRLRCARTATTDTIHMRAHLTGTTALAGSPAGFLSERVRGSTAGSVADSAAVALIEASAIADSIADSATVDSPDVVRLAADSGEERHAVVAFTAAAASTVAVVRTAEADRMAEAVTAADTGKI